LNSTINAEDISTGLRISDSHSFPEPKLIIAVEVLKLIEADGLIPCQSGGGHWQYQHLIKKGRVTIPGKLGKDIAAGTFKSILKQAGLNT
jgi:predicted RNA binding protein YcfA (HicA-like mRNA interferase family)